jgi:nicotinamidase-related amidase
MSERVWDSFLTERDKAHVAALPRSPRWGFGNKPALLLIDLYRSVFGDEPEPLLESINTWAGSCGVAGWQALPHIQELLRVGREAGVPVIHVTGLEDVPGWSRRDDSPVNSSPEEVDRYRRRYDIVSEVAPLEGEIVLRKTAPSAFGGTPLVGLLNGLGVDTLIVAGESTSGCVRASVVDGRTNRYRMIVVEECVFDRHEACHAINLFDMDRKYADVLSLAEVLPRLRAAGRVLSAV